MDATRIVAFVMAGGEGKRLHPLTASCPKPAVPLAGDCRLIDFTLSNLYNSDVRAIYVLAQYCPDPLLRHLASAWSSSPSSEGAFVQTLLPTRGHAQGAYRGTADAVRKNLHLIEQMKPDIVAVFAADHVYRMDVRQMVAFHRQRNADVTVAAIPVPIKQAGRFGIISADVRGRIERFDEKPLEANPMPDNPERAYASMGNYLFDPDVLHHALAQAEQRGGHDFGHHVLPRLLSQSARVYAYDFERNHVPGVQAHEERGYWRDVGTLEALACAQRDLTGPRPRFELRNGAWPTHPCVPACVRAHSVRTGDPMHWHDAFETKSPQTGWPSQCDRHNTDARPRRVHAQSLVDGGKNGSFAQPNGDAEARLSWYPIQRL